MKNTYLYYITSGLSFLLVSLSFIKNDIDNIYFYIIFGIMAFLLLSCIIYFINIWLNLGQHNIILKYKIYKYKYRPDFILCDFIIHNYSNHPINIIEANMDSNNEYIYSGGNKHKKYIPNECSDSYCFKLDNIIDKFKIIFLFKNSDVKQYLSINISWWQKRKLKKLLNPTIMTNSLSKKMFAIGSLGLIGVYCLQFFGFSPCDLCVKQRILVGILISVSALSLVFKKNLDILITICLTAMLGLAIFHVGVEHKIFELPSSCANKIGLDGGMDAMRAMLLDPANIKPACDVPQILFGLSVATWSLLGVLFLYLLTARHWFLRFKK